MAALHPPPCVYETVNPKAVSGDELYGYMTLSKDWKDGVLSIIMRGMSKNYADQVLYIGFLSPHSRLSVARTCSTHLPIFLAVSSLHHPSSTGLPRVADAQVGGARRRHRRGVDREHEHRHGRQQGV